MSGKNIIEALQLVAGAALKIKDLGFSDRVEALNAARLILHDVSPFKTEPVDCVLWEPVATVRANDYNPNAVAPPEMELLRHSIAHDGYTQPVVTWASSNGREVIDGFHRTRVCKECDDVNARVSGYLPVVSVGEECTDRNDRIASTIRHNRARGKHQVDAMTEIVVELKKRNWSAKKIGRELGMDEDEILRLTQVSGLASLFRGQEFSRSWDVGAPDSAGTAGNEILSEEVLEPKPGSRVFHTWDLWECVGYRFYESTPPGDLTPEDAERKYADLLSDENAFSEALDLVTHEWRYSCEHYLTNPNMNRIAWLGQAALARTYKIPACFRGGYNRLSDEQKRAADQTALSYLNRWLSDNGRPKLDEESAASKTEANLY